MNKSELSSVIPIVACGANENQILSEYVHDGDAGVVVVSHNVQSEGPDVTQDVLLLRQDSKPDGSPGDHCLWLGVRRGEGEPVSAAVKIEEESLNSGALDYALAPGRIFYEMKPEQLVDITLNTYLDIAEHAIGREESGSTSDN
jgi:hypothetical protein